MSDTPTPENLPSAASEDLKNSSEWKRWELTKEQLKFLLDVFKSDMNLYRWVNIGALVFILVIGVVMIVSGNDKWGKIIGAGGIAGSSGIIAVSLSRVLTFFTKAWDKVFGSNPPAQKN